MHTYDTNQTVLRAWFPDDYDAEKKKDEILDYITWNLSDDAKIDFGGGYCSKSLFEMNLLNEKDLEKLQ